MVVNNNSAKFSTTEDVLRASFIFNRANMHLRGHLHYACTLLLFPSPLSHHSCLVKFARIKIALAAWIYLNPVPDGT